MSFLVINKIMTLTRVSAHHVTIFCNRIGWYPWHHNWLGNQTRVAVCLCTNIAASYCLAQEIFTLFASVGFIEWTKTDLMRKNIKMAKKIIAFDVYCVLSYIMMLPLTLFQDHIHHTGHYGTVNYLLKLLNWGDDGASLHFVYSIMSL